MNNNNLSTTSNNKYSTYKSTTSSSSGNSSSSDVPGSLFNPTNNSSDPTLDSAKYRTIPSTIYTTVILYESPISKPKETLTLLLLNLNPAEAAYGKHVLDDNSFTVERQVATFLQFFQDKIIPTKNNTVVIMVDNLVIKINAKTFELVLWERPGLLSSEKLIGYVDMRALLSILNVQLDNIKKYGRISFFGESIRGSIDRFNSLKLNREFHSHRIICKGCDDIHIGSQHVGLSRIIQKYLPVSDRVPDSGHIEVISNSVAHAALVIDGPASSVGQFFSINSKFESDISAGIKSCIKYLFEHKQEGELQLELYGHSFGGCTVMATYHYLQILLEIYFKSLDPLNKNDHAKIKELLPVGTKLESVVLLVKSFEQYEIDHIQGLVKRQGLTLNYTLLLLDPGLGGPALNLHVTNLHEPYGSGQVHILIVNSAREGNPGKDISHLKVTKPNRFSIIAVNENIDMHSSAKSGDSLASQLTVKMFDNYSQNIRLVSQDHLSGQVHSTPKRQTIQKIYTNPRYIYETTSFGAFMGYKEKITIVNIKNKDGSFAWHTYKAVFPVLHSSNNSFLDVVIGGASMLHRGEYFTKATIREQINLISGNISPQNITIICQAYGITEQSVQLLNIRRQVVDHEKADADNKLLQPDDSNDAINKIVDQIYQKLLTSSGPLDPVLAGGILARKSKNDLFIVIHNQPGLYIKQDGTIVPNKNVTLSANDNSVKFIYMENGCFAAMRYIGNLLTETINDNNNNDSDFKINEINTLADTGGIPIIYNLTPLSQQYALAHIAKFNHQYPAIGKKLEDSFDPFYGKKVTLGSEEQAGIRKFYIMHHLMDFNDFGIFKYTGTAKQAILTQLADNADKCARGDMLEVNPDIKSAAVSVDTIYTLLEEQQLNLCLMKYGDAATAVDKFIQKDFKSLSDSELVNIIQILETTGLSNAIDTVSDEKGARNRRVRSQQIQPPAMMQNDNLSSENFSELLMTGYAFKEYRLKRDGSNITPKLKEEVTDVRSQRKSELSICAAQIYCRVNNIPENIRVLPEHSIVTQVLLGANIDTELLIKTVQMDGIEYLTDQEVVIVYEALFLYTKKPEISNDHNEDAIQVLRKACTLLSKMINDRNISALQSK